MATISDLYLENALAKKQKFKYGSSAGRDEHGYSLRVGEVMVQEVNQELYNHIKTIPEEPLIVAYGAPANYLEAAGYGSLYEPKQTRARKYIVDDENGEVEFYIIPPGYEFSIITMEKVVYPKGVMGTLWNKSSVPYTLRSPLVDGGFEGHLTLRGINHNPVASLFIAKGTGCMVLVLQDDPTQTISYDGSEYSTNKRFDNG